MKEQDSDGQLLHSFATSRDEAAFRLLARRHLGLVFHTALRRTTGNRALAEDISQNVLLALARKADALAKEPERLPGWLHRATLYEASKAMRAESSYQRRKQLDQEEAAASAPDPAWREALPHLDLALDKLPESDRRVLLLHYFEAHPFQQIAEQLGKNAAAVRKQSQRALEKLSRILRTKGIALSVTALGAGLATQTAKAVPEALIHSASSFAIAGSSSPLAFSLSAMLASKSKVVIPLALLLLATPLALQQLAIAREKDHLRSLRDSFASSSGAAHLSSAPTRIAHTRGPTISSSLDVMALADEHFVARHIGGALERHFYAKLAGLDQNTLTGLIRKTASAPLGMEKRSGLLDALLYTINETDPGLGVITAIEAMPAGPALRKLIWETSFAVKISRWAEKDPAAASAWFGANRDSPKFNSAGLEDPSMAFSGPSELQHLQPYLLSGLLAADVEEARKFLLSLPVEARTAVINGSIAARVKTERDSLGACLQITREFFPPDQQDAAVAQLVQELEREQITGLSASSSIDQGETKLIVALKLREELLIARKHQWETGEAPAPDSTTLKWLEELAPGHSQEWWQDARAAAGQAAATQAADLLATIRASTTMPETVLFSFLTEQDFSSHTAEALELVPRLQDPGLRKKATEHLNAKAKIFATP